jgi:branched-chain amino acid transport system permease protein
MLELLSFRIIIQLLVNGILFGTMYGIAAIGLSLIFGTMRIMFLAQGNVIIFFAYIAYFAFHLAGIDPYLSLVIVLPLGIILGSVLYQGLFRGAAALEDKNVSLLIAVGLMFFIEAIMTVGWGGTPRALTTSYTTHAFRPLGIDFPLTKLLGLLMSILATTGVVLFLKKTFIGMAVKAASEDIVATTLMGISPHRVNTFAFAIGIGLAGVAGVEVATVYSFNPFFGFNFVLNSLISLALGGIGSVTGALLGGIILGILLSVSSFMVPGWSDAIAYAVFLLVLMFKPEGLLVRSVKKA